jgi:hypothetical protein
MSLDITGTDAYDYSKVKKYLCTFGQSSSTLLLVLCYNVNHKFQFVNLTLGRICKFEFDTVEEAEKFLQEIANVLVKDIQIDIL